MRRLSGAGTAVAVLLISTGGRGVTPDTDSKSLLITAAQFRADYNKSAASAKSDLLPRFKETPQEGTLVQLHASPSPHITIKLIVSGPDETIQSVTLELGADGTKRSKEQQASALVWGLGAASSLGREKLTELTRAMFKDQDTRGAVWGGRMALCGYIFDWAHIPYSPVFVQITRQEHNWPICKGEDAPGSSRLERKSGLMFVAIRAGTFRYQGEREVSVNALEIGQTEVTVEAYARCVEAGACTRPGSSDYRPDRCNWGTERKSHPINCVDWHQATDFCAWIGGRLPTAEEWEYVASGGEGRLYPWGYEDPDNARAQWNAEGTAPVGTHTQGDSRWGLHDLAGNVGEWTSTDFDASSKEVRGGWWALSKPVPLFNTHRSSFYASSGHAFFGFRCRF